MPHSIEITKDLYSSVKGASARYREHIEWKKSKTVISQKEKNEILSNGMLKLKKQCDAIQPIIDIMEKDIEKAFGWIRTRYFVFDQK